MSFDKGTLAIQDRLGVLIEDLAGSEQSMLDQVFQHVSVERSNYTEDVLPLTGLPKRQGKLAAGAPSEPRKANLAQITGKVDGRYEGSYQFHKSEVVELAASSLDMERWVRKCRADAAYNIDYDLHQKLINTNHFNAFTRTGAAYTSSSAPLAKDLLALAKKLGRKEDLVVFAGVDVLNAMRENDAVVSAFNNYAGGISNDDQVRGFIVGLGFQDLIIPGRGQGLGKDTQDGMATTIDNLVHPFDGMLWVGRRDAIYNVELGSAEGGIHYLPETKEFLLDYFRMIDIKPVFDDSKTGGMFVTSPLG